MIEYIKRFFYSLKDLCFPLICCNCGEYVESKGLCADCWKQIKWISEPKCLNCGIPFEINVQKICEHCLKKKPAFDNAVSVFEYNDFSKNMILKFKYNDATYMSEQFSSWMYRVCELDIKNANFIIPVPIHFVKRLKRKYNQSELLAKEISEKSGIKYEPRILKKIKNTLAQEGLSKVHRQKNIKGTFEVDKKYVHLLDKKTIVIVDDVLTTGATVNECAKMLKKCGVEKIIVITLARVITH